MSNTLYDTDFNLWIENTIQSLENGDFQSLDLHNLIEELKDLGKSEKNALSSNLMILLAHLLKIKIQVDAPDFMSNIWYNSVDEHRQIVKFQLSKTPSLKSYIQIAINTAYADGRKLAIKEGKRAKFAVSIPPESAYPLSCPFTLEEILDEDFYG